MIARRRAVVSLITGCLLGVAAPAVAAPALAAPSGGTYHGAGQRYPSARAQPGVLQLQTVPAVAGVTVRVDDQTAQSDSEGRIAVRVHNFVGLSQRLVVPETQVAPDRTVVFDRFRGDPDSGARGGRIELGVRTRRLVSWRFLDRFGGDVPIDRVRSMRLRSNTGEILDLTGPQLSRPLWVPESRIQQGPAGLVSKQLYYVVDTAVVGGVSVVNRAQQRFVPWERQQWIVQLLFFKVAFTSADLLFTDRVGKGVELSRPDGSTERLRFGKDGTAVLPDLPRGTYNVRVYGGGVSFVRPVSISRDQDVSLQVISGLDLALIGLTMLAVASGLILLGRPHLRPRWPQRWRSPPRWRRSWRSPAGRRRSWRSPAGRPGAGRALAVGLLLLLTTAAVAVTPARPAAAKAGPTPVLAYYYIWFTPTSWNRAKIDYPVFGRYSSDDTEIMRRHIRMAKSAGIDGFLVSWKHTPQLDERLAKLVSVAREESFRLGIVYQGLDFSRNALPLTTVRADLTLFADQYAGNPVFDVFGKPIIVWTGSERLARSEIDDTVRDLRGKLLVLGAAKTIEDTTAMPPAVDGQAYYWSSVDPAQGASRAKLSAMARAVHERGGIWIAPVTPGFDARLVGGSKTVPRRDGETLRQSFEAARSSNPDAIGVISWNEFSENTHIEPSERYKAKDINVLADLLGARADIAVPGDSSEPAGNHWGLTSWGALLLIGAAAALLPASIALRRRRRAAGARAAAGAAEDLIKEPTPTEEPR